MPAKGTSTVRAPIRLPPLRALRVRRPNATEDNPCGAVFTSVLNCWASSGHTAQNCQALEQSLRACMDTKRPKQTGKSNINQDLNRLYPMIKGPVKKKTH